MKNHRRDSSKSIAAGSPCRSFDKSRKAKKSLFCAALSIATLTAPLALHAQSVSFAELQTTVPAQGLGKTTAVAVDGSGNVFIADNTNSRIVKVTPSGVQTTLISGSDAYDVTQLSVDSAGDLYIMNNGVPGSLYATPQIMEYTLAGNLVIIMRNWGVGQGLTIDHAGDIVADDATTGSNLVQWA